MFTLTDPVADDTGVSSMASDAVVGAAREMQQLARRAEARTVLLAYRIGHAVYQDMIADPSWNRTLGRRVRDMPDKAAIGQVSVRLGISRSTASRWITLGTHLQQLPAVRIAFLDGRHSLARTALMANALLLLDEDTRVGAEQLALTLSARPSADRVLREQLEELVIALDPDAAILARKDFAERHQNVVIGDDAHGHASIDATVPAEHGVYLTRRIADLIARHLCADDPRRIGVQRVAALAHLIGLPGGHLACTCGNTTCPATPAPDADACADNCDDDTPTDTDEADTASSTPADADSDAGLDPTATNTTTDVDTLVDPAEAGAHTDTCSDPGSDAPEAPEGPAVEVADTPTACDLGEQTALIVVTDPAGIEVPYLRGHGPIDPDHAEDLISNSIAGQLLLPSGYSGLIVTGRDGPAPPIDPTGHGGYDLPPPGAGSEASGPIPPGAGSEASGPIPPGAGSEASGPIPPGALTYRPSRAVRERVISHDRTCRYPQCGRPSDECQLDHLVKFDPRDPLTGGWSIFENLIPLCTPDHHRKHLGLWIPTMHTDRTITWRDPITGEIVITYPR
ncbi:HNH endonuclease [Gordonia bronchialis]|uniref:HNH endonuclease signature motif containing protein n=1 Tax=Gordonia bronchialis TaxID=2054 RepID=UPI001CBDCE23|nr:HNH endonuclease signature motif containing protein [Gordonia bronchialis]UAK36982.1 HNH endonuclease [Gordonia bronchialis]